MNSNKLISMKSIISNLMNCNNTINKILLYTFILNNNLIFNLF